MAATQPPSPPRRRLVAARRLGRCADRAATLPPVVWAGVAVWRLCCHHRRPVADSSPAIVVAIHV
eukprot:9492845-Pyramimonas_sp.AAC.1